MCVGRWRGGGDGSRGGAKRGRWARNVWESLTQMYTLRLYHHEGVHSQLFLPCRLTLSALFTMQDRYLSFLLSCWLCTHATCLQVNKLRFFFLPRKSDRAIIVFSAIWFTSSKVCLPVPWPYNTDFTWRLAYQNTIRFKGIMSRTNVLAGPGSTTRHRTMILHARAQRKRSKENKRKLTTLATSPTEIRYPDK